MSWIAFIQGMYFFGGVKMSDAEYMKLAIELAKKVLAMSILILWLEQ